MLNIALYLACTIVWGSTFVVVQYQSALPPHHSLFLRYIISALLFGGLYLLERRKMQPLTRRQHVLIILFGQFNFGINIICFYYAAMYVNPAINSIIFCSKIVITPILVSTLLMRRSPEPKIILGGVLGLLGVFFIMSDNMSGSSDLLLGSLFAVIATFVTCLGDMVYTSKNFVSIGAVRANFYGLIYVLIVLCAYIAYQDQSIMFDAMDSAYIFSLLYLAIFSSFAVWLAYLSLVARIGTILANTLNAFFPLVACAISWSLGHQEITGNIIIGICLQGLSSLIIFLKK